MQTKTFERTAGKKLKTLIIEDEKKGLEYLQRIIQKYCPQLEIVATLASVEEGKAFFKGKNAQIDLALLDISLPDGSVFQLLDSLREINFHIIFTTAHDYAVQAFRYSALDYLMKPIIPEDLAATIKKLSVIKPSPNTSEQLLVFEEHYNNPNAFEKFIINGMDGMHFIKVKDIIRCQGNDNYSTFFLKDETKILVAKTLGNYEALLKRANFYRVHKSHLINFNYMSFYRDGHIHMEDGSKIEVSRRRRKAFLDKIKQLNERFVQNNP